MNAAYRDPVFRRLMNKAAEAWGPPDGRLFETLKANQLAAAQDIVEDGRKASVAAGDNNEVPKQAADDVETSPPASNPAAEDSTGRDEGMVFHHYAPRHRNCALSGRLVLQGRQLLLSVVLGARCNT